MDFATIMVLAVIGTGIVWLVDIKKWKPGREARAEALRASGASADDVEKASKEPVLVEYCRSFFPIILIVLLLRSFIVEPFRIPSGSMMPTLVVGDFILVNKFTYGLRLPVTDQKIVEMGAPKRGDIVVFRFPKDPSVDYIKRVVGLPGDRVAYRNKELFINGERIAANALGQYKSLNTGLPVPGVEEFRETLGDNKHHILIEVNRRNISGQMIVPEGHYFVMGDNRDNSNDSRFWGTVPEENLVGRAFFIWMNLNFDDWSLKWDRIGSSLE